VNGTGNWPTLHDLAAGFDGNKAQRTGDLAGREIVFTNPLGSRVSHRFDATTLEWSYQPGPDDPHPLISGVDDYEAFGVAAGLLYAQFHHRVDVPNAAVSLVLDFDSGHSLAVVSTIVDPAQGRTRVRHDFVPGDIEGLEVRGPAPAPTTALLGRRVLWSFGDEHRYEHAYLGPDSYTWKCVGGPAAGLSDTDECTIYRIRPGIHVFASRQRVIPTASVMIADHRDFTSLRAHGAVFGLGEIDGAPAHFTFGAVGESLEPTAHGVDRSRH
jgi:hypothetical protein